MEKMRLELEIKIRCNVNSCRRKELIRNKIDNILCKLPVFVPWMKVIYIIIIQILFFILIIEELVNNAKITEVFYLQTRVLFI